MVEVGWSGPEVDEVGRRSMVVGERGTHPVDLSFPNRSISRAVHILISLLDAFTKPLTFSTQQCHFATRASRREG